MKKILVTGGAGFIGSNFVEYVLRNRYYQCVVLDALKYSGNIKNFDDWVMNHRNFSFVKGDVRDEALLKNIVQDRGIDWVVHFAAQSHVDRSYSDSLSFVSTNVMGCATLLECLRKHPVEKLIHISTPEVFGTALTPKISEDHPLKPMSPYAGSKAGADRLCYSYYIAYDMPIVILKPSNNYGPRQYPEKLIPLFITNALENNPLPVYADGKSVRDWLHVRDCCDAILCVLEKDTKKFMGEEIILASNENYDVLTIAKLILEILGKPQSLIKLIKDRPGHVARFVFSTEKMEKLLQWRHSILFERGLEETVKWYSDHVSWWKQIKSMEGYKSFYRNWYGSLGLFSS